MPGHYDFGTEWGWGSEEKTARNVFDRYMDEGGNFIDTADSYTERHSEELLGKFIREGGEITKAVPNPVFQRFNEHNWRVLDVLLDVAKQINRPAAQLALNWAASQPGITSLIIGASRTAQLDDNLRFLQFDIPAELRKRLDAVSALDLGHPYSFFEPGMQGMISGGTSVHRWMPVRIYATPSTTLASVAARTANTK